MICPQLQQAIMKKLSYVFILLIAALCPSLATVQAETAKSISTSQIDVMSQTYGYRLDQKYSIERIKKKYPNLLQDAFMAQLEFDQIFKLSYDNEEK
jgi:hypothetical protein